MAEVGIDLGTTNSEVAHLRNRPEIIENRGNPMTPSVVAWDDGEILVGQSAKDHAMVLPSVVSVKSHMGTDKKFSLGDKTYEPAEISAMILRELKRAAEEKLGEPVDSAVITIPAYFSGAQNDATKRAGEMAGLQNVRLLAEPIAAALAYGAEDLVLVYDLGGGTFDVAIIDCSDYKMLGLDGDNHLGGDNFDDRLIAHLAKEVKAKFDVDIESSPESKQLAKTQCEKAKRELSDREQTKVVYQTAIDGKMVNLSLKVTRLEFESLISDLVDSTIEKVKGAIAKAKEKDQSFSEKDIQTILLVGGSTYVPIVRRKVAEFFGKEPSTKVNPDLAVALGAAIHSAAGPVRKGVHRVRIEPLPLVTANVQCKIEGRTTSGARIEARGGATTANTVADERGKFSLTIDLIPDTTNDITVAAISPDGEERKNGFQIRHDSTFTGQEEKGHRKTVGVGGGVLPRTLGIGVSGQDDLMGIILPGQTEIPCSVQNRDYFSSSSAPNMPGQLPISVFEGDLPYAPLNTHLATLMLETPGTPSTSEPLEITFQVTEDHLLAVTARLVNFPDRVVTARIKCESASGSRLHVIERTERVLNTLADRLRPEEKAKLSKAKQALLDLCEQYRRDPQKDRYERIKQTGLQLRTDLDRLEASHS